MSEGKKLLFLRPQPPQDDLQGDGRLGLSLRLPRAPSCLHASWGEGTKCSLEMSVGTQPSGRRRQVPYKSRWEKDGKIRPYGSQKPLCGGRHYKPSQLTNDKLENLLTVDITNKMLSP